MIADKAVNQPKNKTNCLIIIAIAAVIVILLLIVIGYSLLSFIGPTFLLDILHSGKPKLSDEQIDKLINPIAPKGYQYPNPSTEALERTVDCDILYSMPEFPRTNPLCLNVFKTSPEEMTQMISSGSYDRIVLYGQYSVFDAPTSWTTKDYLQDLYQNVKFMDQIAIPKFLSAYGLPDVSYIKTSKPYPYLYYRISSLDDSDKVCHYDDSTEKVQGCARNFYASIIPITAVGPQHSNASPVLRLTDKARFSYLTHYPADCYANEVFLHETSHLLNDAGQGLTNIYVLDNWFNEQIAGFFGIYGAELACGDGTVILQRKPEVKDIPKALIEFNAVFPSANLSHKYPKDDLCRQAILTGWYQYLSKGDYRVNFTRFFTEQRKTTPSLVDDKILANFLLSLDPDPALRTLLLSKGCSL